MFWTTLNKIRTNRAQTKAAIFLLNLKIFRLKSELLRSLWTSKIISQSRTPYRVRSNQLTRKLASMGSIWWVKLKFNTDWCIICWAYLIKTVKKRPKRRWKSMMMHYSEFRHWVKKNYVQAQLEALKIRNRFIEAINLMRESFIKRSYLRMLLIRENKVHLIMNSKVNVANNPS